MEEIKNIIIIISINSFSYLGIQISADIQGATDGQTEGKPIVPIGVNTARGRYIEII